MVKVNFLAQHLELYSEAEFQYVAKVYIVVRLIKIIIKCWEIRYCLRVHVEIFLLSISCFSLLYVIFDGLVNYLILRLC